MGKDEQAKPTKAAGEARSPVKEVVKMANNIPQFKTDFLAFLTTTTTFDASTKTKLRNAMAAEFEAEYIAFLDGAADTAAKKGEFLIEKTYRWWKERVEAASNRAYDLARPAPDTIA